MADHKHINDKGLEAELDAMLGDMDMEAALAGGPSLRPPSEDRFKGGDRVSAVITRVTPMDILVELGPRQQGVCPALQFADAPVEPGTTAEFIVQRFDRGDGLYHLTRVGAVQKADWEHLDIGQVVEAKVTGVNKGGLEMEVAGHRAFMPAGQASLWRVENLEDLLGESMPCEVIEFDRKSRNIVLSRKAVLQREQQAQREQTLATLEEGQTVEGVVRKIMQFGAFVDIGGVDGLIHISDLSHQRIKDPSEVVQEGQRVRVQVLKIDTENNRIGLGLKQTQDDPFALAVNEIQTGATVTGRVTRLAPFGVFVELAPGVEGLVHISELANERINRPDQVVKVDEVVTVKVLEVDPGSRRIALSRKALLESEAENVDRGEDTGLAKLKAKYGDPKNLKGGLF